MLRKAQQADGETFRRWTARRTSDVLRRYGLATSRYGGRRCYRNLSVADIKRIELHYGIELNSSGESHLDVVQVRPY